jgi:hypothetical protein
MKNLIKIAVLCFAISASAQTKNIKVSGTHFADGVDSKRWTNATSGNATADKFNNYTGESYITFISDAPAKLSLDYVLTLAKGKGEIVFSGNGKSENVASLKLGKKGRGVNSDKKTFALEPGKEYRLTLKGEKAKGTFTCNWTEL